MHHPSNSALLLRAGKKITFYFTQTNIRAVKSRRNHKDRKILSALCVLCVFVVFFVCWHTHCFLKKTDVRPKQKDTDCIIAISSSKWQFTLPKNGKGVTT
jgi:hypothetical protein